MRIPVYVWILLLILLIIDILGLRTFFITAFIGSIIILGFSTSICLSVHREIEEYCTIKDESIDYKFPYLEKVVENYYKSIENDKINVIKKDKRLTGSREIDEPLQHVIDHLLQDYVHPWYHELSDDDQFLQCVQNSIQRTIVTLVTSIKDADWISYLTTKLIDDAASHLRLYRQAKFKCQTESTSSSIKKINYKNLEKHFFDLEYTMEQKMICRDSVCLDDTKLSQYLTDISEVLLFLILPETDFNCEAIRMLLRDILSNSVLLPLINLLSEPDFINRTIIKLAELRRLPFTSDVLLGVLKTTDSIEELNAVLEILNQNIYRLRSCDMDFNDSRRIKQQLSSLTFTRTLIEDQLNKLHQGSAERLPYQIQWNDVLLTRNLIELPLDVLLKNNIALSYFIDYMKSIDADAYLSFYLNIEGWRITAEQQLSELSIQQQLVEQMQDNPDSNTEDIILALNNFQTFQVQTFDNLKSNAKSIWEQYLSDKATNRLKLNEHLIKRVYERINGEYPMENWFDQIQHSVHAILNTEERFAPAFRKSYGYLKLLEDMDLLKDRKNEIENLTSFNSESNIATFLPPYHYRAEILKTGVATDHGNKYGIYNITVHRTSEISGTVQSWQICRRYSDFLNIHQKLKEKYENLGKLPFPSKKAFHNTERSTLDKRMKELNGWLQMILIQIGAIYSNDTKYYDAGIWVENFLQQGDYEHQDTHHFGRTMEQLFMKPIKTSLRTVGNVVKSVPETMSKAIHSRSSSSRPVNAFEKVGAAIDVEGENIPLRIMLLLLDEVFDLKTRNQWLRRRIVLIVREIIKGMFGDIVNKRILDYVSWLTSPTQIAFYIECFRNKFWPNGVKAETELPRKENEKNRTKVCAKMALLASLTDDIKRIMGTETTKRSILIVFEMFQNPLLNRRLSLVLFEGVLTTLFSHHNFVETFQKLHCSSKIKKI